LGNLQLIDHHHSPIGYNLLKSLQNSYFLEATLKLDMFIVKKCMNKILSIGTQDFPLTLKIQ